MGITIRRSALSLSLLALVGTLLAAGTPAAGAASDRSEPGAYWSAARRANAVPRDLVLNAQGQAYLRRPNGTLTPYGDGAAGGPSTLRAVPQAKPDNPGGGGGNGGGGGDGTNQPTSFGVLDPAEDDVIGASHTFTAEITDPDGIKSVTFELTPSSGGRTQNFSASLQGGVWTSTLQGFLDGQVWDWRVVVQDRSKKGGVTTSSDTIRFSVAALTPDPDPEPDPDPDPDLIVNDPWTGGGAVQTAAGRIYFEMPTNGPNWGGYVCSGTVVDDGTAGRSVIITAAHCVYDDVNNVFARNVLFIPDQVGTTGVGTDLDCSNDPIGCWSPSHGVVDNDWTTTTFPTNIPWDYAYYVVPDQGKHSAGSTDAPDALDEAITPLTVNFEPTTPDALTHALGYSYSDDPNFMYCAETVSIEPAYDDLWLSQCGLSGGSSGGPWLQPVDDGNGPIVSVNSWGYTDQPGMGGPPLDRAAGCVFDAATSSLSNADRGVVVTC